MPTKEKVRIEYISLEKLKRWPRNPKDHDLGEISQSLARFGYVAPILIDERSKKIVAGHGRLDSLLSMKDDGQKPPGRIVLKNGSWFVPVIRGIRFSSDREAEGYLLADNRLTEVGGWHEDILAEVLSEFAKEDSLDGLGWDADDVDEIVKGIQTDEPQEAPEAQIDKADELQKKWRVKLGQVWSIGNHKLMCGDSTKREDVERVMGGKKAALVMADPPYNVKYTGGSSNERDRADSYVDQMTDEQYTEWLKAVLSNAFRSSDDQAALLLWFSSNKMRCILDGYEGAGWTQRNLIIWNKLKAHYGALGAQYKHRLEPMWYCYKPGKTPRFFGESNECNVWDVDQPHINDLHPTMKPIELYVRCVGNHSEKGDSVVELFGGSGTTMVACQNLNRKCRGIEISPAYCAVILQRMSDMGLKPKLMS